MRTDLYEDIKFSDLFDNERQAVVCYLSLERRYMDMLEYYKRRVRNLEREAP